ncbi:MAG: phosphoribosylformylglycinamidine synthase [Cyclobacteriaceae bacterium]|nr:phosphoribosylformylglycinamidine synthase [Cyclobacteriaceae bacterium]
MITFFENPQKTLFAVQSSQTLAAEDILKLEWLFGKAKLIKQEKISGEYIGPRSEMVTPWSTNAVEITQNMGISGIARIEEFESATHSFDHMLQRKYDGLAQNIFDLNHEPEKIQEIEDIAAYNLQEGLALNDEEIEYLEKVSKDLDRKLTDSEVFGFSQVNSEHCRHKIFNGVFVIDGKEKDKTLFQLIKKTSLEHPNRLVSAYKDNVAFIQGPKAIQFAPATQYQPDFFENKEYESVISLKAETHNFPTTVEPFNGAATGSGGEIRDRMAGGKASMPLAGTAVYMTSYPRTKNGRTWEEATQPRKWLYQTPLEILIKASNGASDFGNKFGQPLISGSLLTFEHEENEELLGYDKVIMLAGGIGYGKKKDSIKGEPKKGDQIVVLGGDNYRIGMGGGAVSSVATGEYSNAIELNAVQRSNPEMQKRVSNAVRAMAEMDENPIISIHDHGAGGHLNCLSELVESTGGAIEVAKLPVGDPTLSEKEIIGNESQERMGLVIGKENIETLEKIAERERSPIYEVGETTGDMHFRFIGKNGKNPIDWSLIHMFGSSPTTVINDSTIPTTYTPLAYEVNKFAEYVTQVLQLESVACKDWLTNKVDRSVTGKVAKQQSCGQIQLPLNNVGVMAIDYMGEKGIATSIGHNPISALINPVAGSRNSIAEALTNIIWAPLEGGLNGVSLSANWMWPSKNKGEDARLYRAVEAVSDFACDLGINIPTGKDSLSMTQKYKDGKSVKSPGTVIISAVAEVTNINRVIEPALQSIEGSQLLYINLSKESPKLGGSSLGQVLNAIGNEAPTITDAGYFAKAFNVIQEAILAEEILAGHDVSDGGLITTLLEMAFPTPEYGLRINSDTIDGADVVLKFFSQNSGLVLQVASNNLVKRLESNQIRFSTIGEVISGRKIYIDSGIELSIDELRDTWFSTSYLLDREQSGPDHAKERFTNYKNQPLNYSFSKEFTGKLSQYGLSKAHKKGIIKAAIIREKGVNGDREMAHALYLAGFEVKDVHMTDLISGREDLSEIQMIVFVGGFSNSDVLGSAKGWAGAFLYNPKAKEVLDNFYKRSDTLSLGVCNGCQLMMELGLIYDTKDNHPTMKHNSSHKFESGFVTLHIPENNSVMFSSLANCELGAWVAHGEGKFKLNSNEARQIVSTYSYEGYPGNPNGSDFNAAAVCSADGRHLAIMPHLERSIFPWNWPYYTRKNDEVSPWIEAFVNARKWLEKQNPE